MSVQVVVAKYNEDVGWTQRCPHKVVIYSKNPDEPNYVHEGRGSETTSYLRHIIDNYDTLREWTLFVHGHEFHWHHPMSVLKSCEMDLDALKGHCKFLSINHGRWGIRTQFGDYEFAHRTLPIMVYRPSAFTPSELSRDEYCQVMHDVFGAEEFNAIVSKYFPNDNTLRKQSYPPCAQFYVHKDRIRARPKSFYENCYKLCADKSYLLGKLAGKGEYKERTIAGFFFEANWHYIFGEEYLYIPPYASYNNYPFKSPKT